MSSRKKVWESLIGPDFETDDLYSLVCAECGTELEPGEERWFMRVAFCADCCKQRRVEPEVPVSEARLRLRKHMRRES